MSSFLPQKVEKNMGKAASGMGKARIKPPKNLFLEVDHKRKASDGLPSLAVRCGGGPSRILKKVKPWSVIFSLSFLFCAFCLALGNEVGSVQDYITNL